MVSKFRRAEMTYSSEDEIEQLKEICSERNWSVSDALRHAVNVAYSLNWPAPLYRKAIEEIQPNSRAQRERRKKGGK